MAKNNIRSFRYSDEVAAILEQQKGSTLNEKFENLVLYCFKELPSINKRIAEQKKLLAELQDNCFKLRQMVYDYQQLDSERNRLSTAITQVAVMAEDFKEKLQRIEESGVL